MQTIADVDAMGGALAAIERGYFQKELAKQQFERQRQIEDGSRKLVGVNHLAKAGEKRGIEIFELDPGAERRQIERLRRVRAGRDDGRVERALARVRDAARGSDNLVPPILEAVKEYASEGEICDVLRETYGTYHPDSLTSGV